MDGQLVAIFDRLNDLVNVAEIEAGVDPLRVHVERHRHQIAIAGALAIAEQTAFDTVRARHQPQFRRCNASAAIIMRVQ